MGRGGGFYLSYTALVLLAGAATSNASLWSIHIDESPAPSPEDGPSFSAHASRNRALLPFQIIGIISGYLGFTLILGTLTLTVGRRLRMRAQRVALDAQEMVKPVRRTIASYEQSRMSDQDRLAQLYSHVWQVDEQRKQDAVSSNTELGQWGNALPPGYHEMAASPSYQAALGRATSSGSGRTATTDGMAPKRLKKRLADIKTTMGPGSSNFSPVISSPIQRWGRDRNRDKEMMTPLSASFGEDPRFPPAPPTGGSTNSSAFSPISPQTPRTPRTMRFANDDVIHEEDVEAVRAMPHPEPQRPNAYVYSNEAQVLTDVASTRPDPTHFSLPARSRNATNRTNVLPLRQQYEQPHGASEFLSASGHDTQTSLKTTILEARQGGPGLRGGDTPGRPPLTAMYTPGIFTPVTPVVMSLPTRAERRQIAREGRALHGPIMEEDLVADDKDLWSSAY